MYIYIPFLIYIFLYIEAYYECILQKNNRSMYMHIIHLSNYIAQ